MRLLVLTQIMDRKDPTLGFFVRWVEELARRTEHVDVICLSEGKYDRPDNVAVYSLGKENPSYAGLPHLLRRIIFIARFYGTLFRLRRTYDTVLVHMNEEYVLLGGLFWKLITRPVFLWRNHYAGSFLTRLAGKLATRVFYTSRYSYTATFPNAVMMPVGVDVDSLSEDIPVEREPLSILFLARFSPSKRPHLLVAALTELHAKGVSFRARFVGGSSEGDEEYRQSVIASAQSLPEGLCEFVGAVPNTETFRYYRSHDIYVNCASSGMLDKTIFKAAAAGCIVVTASEDIREWIGNDLVFKDGDALDLARVLEKSLALSSKERGALSRRYATMVNENTLSRLADELVKNMEPRKE